MLRTIVGTWESRDAWEAWHGEDAFRETRERLDGL
jgi:heme-degrading monooxygenase HmoA